MVKFFPNIFKFFKLMICKVNGRPNTFSIKVVFENMIDDLIAFLDFESIEIKQQTGESRLRQFIELKVIFAALKNFEFGIEMEIFHLLYENFMIDAKLEHLNRVENRILFLSCENLLQRLFEQEFVLFDLEFLYYVVQGKQLLDRISDQFSPV